MPTYDIENGFNQQSEHAGLPIETVIIHENEDISYWQYFQKISKLSLEMSASYTFSLEMVILVYLLSHVNGDKNHLAASGLTTAWINSLICIGVSPLLAMSQVVGKELGALEKAKKSPQETTSSLHHKRQSISAIFGNGLILAAPTSVVTAICMIFSKSILVGVFNQDEAVAEITQNFVRPYAAVIPAITIRVCADQIMFMFERTTPAMCIGLFNLALSMGLGSFLAFGSPQWGSNGILTGAILNEYLTAVGYCLYLANASTFKEFNFYHFCQSWKPYIAQLANIAGLGRSIMLSVTTETGMLFMLNIYAGMLGVESQAEMAAIMQFSLMVFLLQLAFSQTAAQEMSRQAGKNNFNHASLAGKTGFYSLLLYLMLPLTVASIFPQILITIQGSHSQINYDSLRILAPNMFAGAFCNALRFFMSQQLGLLGDSQKASIISSSFVILSIILSGFLGLKTNMGIDGVALGFTLPAGIAFCSLLYRWVNRIQPERIEHAHKHPENFYTINTLCKTFFSSEPNKTKSNVGTELKSIQTFSQENPVIFANKPI